MRKILEAFILILGIALLLAPPAVCGESKRGKPKVNLDDIFGDFGNKKQKMEKEDVSTATAIRGLNPVSQKYGADQSDLAPYIKDVKAMEERAITENELRQFLMDEGLGKR